MKGKIFILIMMLFGSVCLFNVKCFAKIAPDIEPDVDPYFTSLLNTNLYHTSGEKVISCGGIYEIQKNNNGYYSFKSNIKIESDFMYHKQNVICTNNVVFK